MKFAFQYRLLAILLSLSAAFDGAIRVNALPADGDDAVVADPVDISASGDIQRAPMSTTDLIDNSGKGVSGDAIAPDIPLVAFNFICMDEPDDSDSDSDSGGDNADTKDYEKVASHAELDPAFLAAIKEKLPNPLPKSNVRPAFELTTTKKLLLFDLDETLIYVKRNNPHDTNLKYRTRPGLNLLISTLAKYYELGIWTASKKTYADEAISEIGLEEYFPMTHRIYGDTDGLQFKDVKPLKELGFDMHKVVMVDNWTSNFIDDKLPLDDGKAYATNGVNVMNLEYGEVYTIDNYRELKLETLRLLNFLLSIRNEVDVRPYILWRNKMKRMPIEYEKKDIMQRVADGESSR